MTFESKNGKYNRFCNRRVIYFGYQIENEGGCFAKMSKSENRRGNAEAPDLWERPPGQATTPGGGARSPNGTPDRKSDASAYSLERGKQR